MNLFFAALWLVGRRWPIERRFLIALVVETAWEIAENTPMVIDRYRETKRAAEELVGERCFPARRGGDERHVFAGGVLPPAGQEIVAVEDGDARAGRPRRDDDAVAAVHDDGAAEAEAHPVGEAAPGGVEG